MIKVTIYKDKNNYINQYVVSGHANYDEYGKDIVCAAVSILTQTALISLVEVSKVEEEKIQYSIDDDSGFLNVQLLDGIGQDKFLSAQIILKSLLVGLESIIDSYPEYVTLQYREV